MSKQEKLVWKKPKIDLKQIIIGLFKEPETQQIEKEARRRQLQEVEDQARHAQELKNAAQKGREKASTQKKSGSIFKGLLNMGDNVTTNMKHTKKRHRRNEPDDLLEGIL